MLSPLTSFAVHLCLTASLALSFANRAYAQGGATCLPDIPNPANGLEELAATGSDFASQNNRLWEPDVAAGPRTVMAVFNHQRVPQGNRIGYAFRDTSGSWSEALTPNSATDGSNTFTISGFGDVSVVYDRFGETSSADGGFVCAAFAQVPQAEGDDDMIVVFNRYVPGTGWGDWVEIYRRTWETSSFPVDKPFLLAGEDDEFYIV